jgi:hypothetical protein
MFLFTVIVMMPEIYEDNLEKFVYGATQLINTPCGYSTSTIFGTKLHVDRGNRFDLVRGNETNPSYPHGYTYARIERATGNIYSQYGKKVRGTIYSEQCGLEFVVRGGPVMH